MTRTKNQEKTPNVREKNEQREKEQVGGWENVVLLSLCPFPDI